MKNYETNEANYLEELEEILIQTKKAKNEIINIMPEMRRELEAFTCIPDFQHKMSRICILDFKPSLAE